MCACVCVYVYVVWPLSPRFFGKVIFRNSLLRQAPGWTLGYHRQQGTVLALQVTGAHGQPHSMKPYHRRKQREGERMEKGRACGHRKTFKFHFYTLFQQNTAHLEAKFDHLAIEALAVCPWSA